MKEILEEYGGTIAGCLVAIVLLTAGRWCREPEGPLGVLTAVFGRLTLGG